MHLYRYMHYKCLFNSKGRKELLLAQFAYAFLRDY